MPATITTHAREENNYVVSIAFTDENGTGCTAATLVWTLSDMDGNIVNSRNAVSASPTSATAILVLSGTDTVITAGQTNERLLLIEWTYASTYGSAMIGKEQAVFVIDNLLKVT